MNRLSRTVLAALLVALAATPAAARNMIRNGNFEKGGVYPDGWYVRLTDFMPETTRHDGGARSYNYICACGHNLGEWKPWCGLFCPKCKGFISGEECGSWYVRNHERVSLVEGRSGKCIKFTLPRNVGNNQGVRVFSALVKAKPGWGYILTFDARTSHSIARVFVECYREIKREGSYTWDPKFNPHKLNRPIERCHRAHVNCAAPTNINTLPDTERRTSRAERRREKEREKAEKEAAKQEPPRDDWRSDQPNYEPPPPTQAGPWKRYRKEVVAPRRYRFEWMTVKLYAYMPGEAWFDNIHLRPMTRKELKAFVTTRNARIRDKRFRY